MIAHIKKSDDGYTVDIRGEETLNYQFFVTKIIRGDLQWISCNKCYACWPAEGAIARSVFPEDSIPLDAGNIKYCQVCGKNLY